MGSFPYAKPNDGQRQGNDMASEVRAGGCERCGSFEEVHYFHWQFLCKDCRENLTLAQVREHIHALAVARAEAEISAGREGVGAG